MSLRNIVVRVEEKTIKNVSVPMEQILETIQKELFPSLTRHQFFIDSFNIIQVKTSSTRYSVLRAATAEEVVLWKAFTSIKNKLNFPCVTQSPTR